MEGREAHLSRHRKKLPQELENESCDFKTSGRLTEVEWGGGVAKRHLGEIMCVFSIDAIARPVLGAQKIWVETVEFPHILAA